MTKYHDDDETEQSSDSSDVLYLETTEKTGDEGTPNAALIVVTTKNK